jgi:hypothetical protein
VKSAKLLPGVLGGRGMKQPIYVEFSEKRWMFSRLFPGVILYLLAPLVALTRAIPLGWLIVGLGIGIVTGCIGAALDAKATTNKVVTFKKSDRLLGFLLLAAALLYMLSVPLALVGVFSADTLLLLFYCVVANGAVVTGTHVLVGILFLYAYHRRRGPLSVIVGYRCESTASRGEPTIKIKAKVKPQDHLIDDKVR